ncbi:AfsR/SARP family transcriptional regulator [Mangrovihabitans endophyticus]|uniref:Bacterial transcriptional activator domain-containing protein n=1 Tax=Mangrovihabitans endophyticus TaxID=1751298 RepID=A0A8J3BW23_9ACTN|nr:BTAD domain-containing putative transcriptional regulator [Mangrovihabitans endophyticus]GGK81829.1 hypothetical protein GCM10012284_14870 [Mangrovihabitans endophyticus]
MAITIELLGVVRVLRDGEPVDLSRWWTREVLALMAFDAGTYVSREQLARRVRDGDLDAGTHARIERAVRELEQVFAMPHGSEADGPRVERSAGGGCVRLLVPADGTDLMQVERLHTEAGRAAGRGDYTTAVELTGEALERWTGPGLQELRTGPRWPETTALHELRALLEQDHYYWMLAGGADPAGAVDRVTQLAAAHPADESWCALLMAVLTAAGRTDEAATAYDRMTERLTTEWGLQPGPRLRGERRRLDRATAASEKLGAEVSIIVVSRDPELSRSDDETIWRAVRGREGIIIWRIHPVTMGLFTGPGHCARALDVGREIQRLRERHHPALARTARTFVGSGWADRCTLQNSARQGATGPILAGTVLSEGREAFFEARPGAITVDASTAERTAELAGYEADGGGYRVVSWRR